jgi:hypothetical protein
MTAPRSSALRALRLLSQQHTATPAIRRTLHITGANSAQPANVSDRTSLYSTRSLADLKSECQKRALRTSGTQAEVSHPAPYGVHLRPITRPTTLQESKHQLTTHYDSSSSNV